MSYKYKSAIMTLIVALITMSIFCGCSSNEEVEEEITYTFTVISDGEIMAEIEEEEEEESILSSMLIIPDYMVTKYASLSYDSRHADVYDEIVEVMQSFGDFMYIPLTIGTTDYVQVLETVRCEQLWLFAIESRTVGDFSLEQQTFEMDFTYKYSIYETNLMLREIEAVGDEIFANIDDSMSDYEKLKYFHDWLVMNCESSTDAEYADTIYGALVTGEALCEGFAKAFSYLCNRAGIENMIITGNTGVDHMWNMVKLDDGNWYHVDVGWDKADEALLEIHPDIILYQYFLVSDDIIENTRTISTYFGDVPVAESNDYSYFVMEGRYASTYEEALDIIEDGCRDCIDSGESYFMIKLSSSNLFLQVTEWLQESDEEGVSDIDRIMQNLNFAGEISYTDYYKSHRVIIFIIDGE